MKKPFYQCYSRYADRIVLKDDTGQQLTYRQLAAFSDRLGKAGETRSLVFVLCSNRIGSVAGYVSFLEQGMVPLLLDQRIEEELLLELIHTYRPEYLYGPEVLLVGQDRPLCRELLLEESFAEYGYVLVKCQPSSSDHYHEHEEGMIHEDLALLLTTSGSTGSPRLVRQSYANLESNARAIAAYLSLTADEKPITTLPMNYTYGLSVINSHLSVGACILLTEESVLSLNFWQMFMKEGATSFAGVPYTYQMLRKLRFERMNLPSLRYVTQAGGALPMELQAYLCDWAEKQGKQVYIMYGQTEATARMAYLPPDQCRKKAGSMGIAIPGGRFELLDDQGNYIADHDLIPDSISGKMMSPVGELIYQGPNVTMGYAECRADLAKGDEFGGILHTGDMARRDADACYYIVGRKKRFLKVYGNRVNLDELDQLLKKGFADIDCASTGLDDHVIVYVTEEKWLDQIPAYLSQMTHLNESAFESRYLPEIPRNESGKIIYRALKTN